MGDLIHPGVTASIYFPFDTSDLIACLKMTVAAIGGAIASTFQKGIKLQDR
jgi:hypothetical protein